MINVQVKECIQVNYTIVSRTMRLLTLADNHTESEKTTKRWEADDLARGRLSADGRVRQPKKALSVVSR
jgi:hypothetical protein